MVVQSTTMGALDSFVDDVASLFEAPSDEATLPTAVAHRLEHLLQAPDWLDEEYCEPWDDRYRQHLLYVAPGGIFSVVALVWKPGQQTPIHDHVAWCVAGVLVGCERETRYRLYQQDDERFLVERGARNLVPGEASALVPPDEDIHRVECTGTGQAISIHVYGADIGRLGSSINHRFDDVAIRKRAGIATPVSWRQAASNA